MIAKGCFLASLCRTLAVGFNEMFCLLQTDWRAVTLRMQLVCMNY